MWIARFAVPVALVLALIFACFAPRGTQPERSVSAKEVLVQAQRVSGRNYTYSQNIAQELDQVQLERPALEASRESLEAALGAAGFSLTPVGPAEANVFRVDRARG